MVIFHGELLVITRWYVNKRPTIMRHFPEHKPLETVSGLNLKNPWFCRVSDSPVHRCWIPNIVNSSGIIVTSSNSQMNPLPIGVLKVDFHGCVFSSLLQVMQNKQHCTVTGCFLTMSMTVIDWDTLVTVPMNSWRFWVILAACCISLRLQPIRMSRHVQTYGNRQGINQIGGWRFRQQVDPTKHISQLSHRSII